MNGSKIFTIITSSLLTIFLVMLGVLGKYTNDMRHEVVGRTEMLESRVIVAREKLEEKFYRDLTNIQMGISDRNKIQQDQIEKLVEKIDRLNMQIAELRKDLAVLLSTRK